MIKEKSSVALLLSIDFTHLLLQQASQRGVKGLIRCRIGGGSGSGGRHGRFEVGCGFWVDFVMDIPCNLTIVTNSM